MRPHAKSPLQIIINFACYHINDYTTFRQSIQTDQVQRELNVKSHRDLEVHPVLKLYVDQADQACKMTIATKSSILRATIWMIIQLRPSVQKLIKFNAS